jgi:hypothetical protein
MLTLLSDPSCGALRGSGLIAIGNDRPTCQFRHFSLLTVIHFHRMGDLRDQETHTERAVPYSFSQSTASVQKKAQGIGFTVG